jgi:hypothetical protein
MPAFEDTMNTLLAGLTLEQVTALAEAAKRRQSEMENDLINNAKVKFIKAYQDYRKLAPNATGYISWEYDNNSGEWEEQDFDLYAMLDCAIAEGFV